MDVLGDIRAPDEATLDLYCNRVASAVGRLSVRVFGMEEQDGIALAHHLGRALQLTNILRDLDEDAAFGRLYLPAEALRDAGITASDPATVLASPALGQVCARVVERAREHFAQADKIMARSARRTVRAPRIMAEAYRLILDRLVARGWSHPRRRNPPAALAAGVDHSCVTPSSDAAHGPRRRCRTCRACRRGAPCGARGTVWSLHEAAGQAGGRCRSYHDPVLDMVIDNGNHLLLSANHAALSYLETIGAQGRLAGPPAAEFAFMDLASGERWTVRINAGRLPWWIFDRSRRVPGTTRARLSCVRAPAVRLGDKERSAKR